MAGGFFPVNSFGEQGYNGQVITYYVASSHGSALTVGDLVLETGVANSSTGTPGVDACTAGSLISGVIVAILPNPLNLNISYLPASTAGYVLVAPATNTLLLRATVATGITVNDVGANADIVATAATVVGTSYAASNMVIDGSTYSSSTYGIRIVSLDNGNTGAGATVLCRINESTVSGTVGV